MRKLILHIGKIDFGIEKTNSSKLEILNMIIASFMVDDNDKKSWFFKESFLLADYSIDITLGMPLVILNNLNDQFCQLRTQIKIIYYSQTSPHYQKDGTSWKEIVCNSSFWSGWWDFCTSRSFSRPFRSRSRDSFFL